MADKIVMRSVEELIPYARKARTHSDEQVAQIAGSIREFGFTNPVLIDEKDVEVLSQSDLRGPDFFQVAPLKGSDQGGADRPTGLGAASRKANRARSVRQTPRAGRPGSCQWAP
jgi:hypothetical protein